MDFKKYNESPNIVRQMKIGNHLIYIPRKTIRAHVRIDAEKHLRKKFNPGIYTGKIAIEIANHLFSFYESRLNRKIRKISKSFFVYFALFQYEKATKIQNSIDLGHISDYDFKYWQSNGPLYRRTIGYLLDKLVKNLFLPFNDNLGPVEAYCILEECMVCCENAIKYATISNEIYYLNESYKIEILPPNRKFFITTCQTFISREYTKKHNYYRDQSTKDIALRSHYIAGIPFESDWKEHGRILNPAFENSFGLTYHEIMFVLSDTILNSKEITRIEDIPLVNKKYLINEIANQLKADKKKVELFFEGLILRKSQFKHNARTIWKYKQPYRINKRPFIELKDKNKVYLTWSSEMFKERLTLLDKDFIFKTIPPEWMNNQIIKSIDIISNKAGSWFETQVKSNLNNLGIIGDKIKDKIIQNSTTCNAKSVGGFDFLGYCPNTNMIIIIECKYMDSGFEPKSYYDDLSDFQKPNKGYIAKIDKKVNWVLDNFSELKKELSIRHSYPIPKTCKKIGAAFFTYVMTFAYAFIEEYPCVSFTDFLYNYEIKKRWYFKKGIYKTKKPCA